MKKLLALVLALVMTLGLATVSSSAAYSDAADVSLTEAVDVMSAVGVFQGSDGKFSPKENLTREQAAKLIAYLDLGENTAEALPAVKVFDDVEATRWSAKYIAYCKDAGYIAGVGNGKFNPTGELTGYAFGKMVLCALGYDADIEGFTGGNWSINVAKLMESNGITDGIDSAASLTLTREQAAQYCFNALQADMVWYDGVTAGTTVTTSDGTTVTANGSNGTRKVATTANFGTLNGNGDAWNAFTSTDNTLQLGEYLYNTKLMPSSVTDDFGRSATKWTYKTDDVVTYADEADKTYVVAKSGKSVATILTDSAYIGLKSDKILPAATLYINGFQVGTNYASFDTEVILQLGDTVELFYDSNSRVENIVVRRYFASEIDKVSTSLGSTHTAQGATTSIKLKAAQNTNYSATATLYDEYKNDSDKVLNGFNANTYVEGAILAVAPEVTAYNLATNAATYSNGTTAVILDSYVANTVEGKVTNFKSADYITLDGTKYTAGAGVNGTDITYTTNKITALSFTNTYKLFLDANNYILGFDGTNSAVLDDVVYVDGLYVVKGNTGNLTYYAVTVGLDGVKKEIQIEAQDFFEKAFPGNCTTGTQYYAGVASPTTWSAWKNVSVDQTTFEAHETDYYTRNGMTFTQCTDGATYVAGSYYQEVDASATDFSANTMYALNALYTFKDSSSADGRSSGNGKSEMIAYTGADSFTYYKGTSNSAITSSSLSVAFTGGAYLGENTNQASRLYFTDDTKFLAVKGTGDELSVKTATKLMTMDTSTSVIAIYADGKTDASYIIFYGANLTSSATSTKDVYYLASNASVSVGSNKYSVTLYPMDNPASPLEDVIIAGGGTTTVNFVTIESTDSDGVRKLTTTGVGSATDVNNNSANTGAAPVTITSSKNGYLSGTGVTNCTDVDYKSATIIDSRTDAQRELDKYAEKITSVETMEEALDEGSVVANVYFNNGKVTFIAVQSAANKEYTVVPAVLSGAPAGTTISTSVTSAENDEQIVVTVVIPSGSVINTSNDKATLSVLSTKADNLAASSSTTTGSGITASATGAYFDLGTGTSTAAVTLVFTADANVSAEGDTIALTVTFD